MAGGDRTRRTHRPDWLWLVPVFGVALVVRLVHTWQIGDAPFADLRLGDAESDDAWAREIAAGNWLGDEIFYQAPLYPYFLGTVYALFGKGIAVVRLCQALLGAVACVFLAAAGRRLVSRRAGVVAGLIMALYAPAVFYDGLIQKATLDLLFLAVVLWLLALIDDRPQSTGSWLALGGILACLVLTRENALVFVPAILLWLVTRVPSPSRNRWKAAGAFAAGLIVVLFPVALRNGIVGGEFHLTTSQFGPNFYIGNHEGSDGLYEPLRPGRGHPRYERQDATALAEQATGRQLTPGQVSAYWTKRALDFIATRPLRWLSLMARKTALTWNAVEIIDSEDIGTYSTWSTPLRWLGPVLHFGVLGPLALVGVWVTWPDRRRIWPIYLLLGIYAGSVALFFVFGRYRYPMVPFLVLLAAAGLTGARAFVRNNSPRVVVLAGASVVAFAVFCNWPMLDERDMSWTARMNMASALDRSGRLPEAIEQYEQALELRPNSAETLSRLGIACRDRGEPRRARDYLERALAIDAGSARAHFGMGKLLADGGDLGRAAHYLRRAVALDPGDAPAHSSLGTILFRSGDPEGAAAQYRQALTADPGYGNAHNNLGNVYMSQGRYDEARQRYEEAIRLAPDNVQAHFNLGVVHERQGNRQRAAESYRRALVLDPEFEPAERRLAGLAGR